MRNEEHLQTEQVDIINILASSLRYKRVVAMFVIGAMSISVILCILLENRYTSTALVAPSLDENSSLLSTLANSFGGLGGLSGIQIGSSLSENDQAIAQMTSIRFVMQFVESNHVRVNLFYKNWDGERREWREPGPLKIAMHYVDKYFNGIGDARLTGVPSDEKVYKRFLEEVFKMDVDKKTGLVRLSITTPQKELSKQWLDKLIVDLNNYIRNEKKKEYETNIKYLNDKISETNVAELRLLLQDLIKTNTQNIMLASTREEFAFKVIDPASLPERPSEPNRLLIVLMSSILGGLIGCAVSYWKSSKNDLRVTAKHEE